MAKKQRKDQSAKDLSSQHEFATRLGTLPHVVGTLAQVVGLPSVLGPSQPLMIARTFTTYSAYEDPISAE